MGKYRIQINYKKKFDKHILFSIMDTSLNKTEVKMKPSKTELQVQFSRLIRKVVEGNELTEQEGARVTKLAQQLNTIFEMPAKIRNKTKRNKIRKSKSQTQSHWTGSNKL